MSENPTRGRRLLEERVVVVLHEPRDLVNVALVVRAMKNMGLRRLRAVRPAEWDPYRIDGIAHGTKDVVAGAERPDTLDEALADVTFVAGTSARRRSSRQRWWEPEEAAGELLARADQGDVALLLGREDRGLSNRDLDRCHAVIHIPSDPRHPSLNLQHAALLVFWELWKAAGAVPAGELDLLPKRRRRTAPAPVGKLEEFFEAWEKALDAVGFFHDVNPLPKMRSFRSLFQRAEPDLREVGLLEAAAHEILHYARRERLRILGEGPAEGGRATEGRADSPEGGGAAPEEG